MLRVCLLSLFSCLSLCLPTSAQSADVFLFQHEHVLGTSCEIKVWANDRSQAEQVEAAALAEIDRLQKVFSAHDPQSELMRWQRGDLSGDQLSRELVKVLGRAEFWRAASNGAFDVRAGELGIVWKEAARQNRLPDDKQLNRVIRLLATSPYVIDAQDRVTRHDKLSITLDAIAKGFILDAACERAWTKAESLAVRNNSGLSIMIGGDLRMVGLAVQKVSIANPLDASENGRPAASVQLKNSLGLATSGGYRRFNEIGGLRYSHILDPRTGQAALSVAGVTVIAPNGMDADAAATAVSVLGPVAGLEMIEKQEGYAALVILNSGEVVASSRWYDHAERTSQSPGQRSVIAQRKPLYVNVITTADDKNKPGLFVKFTLGAAGGGRYHRPYVAVWLEDKDGFPVKTSVLWLQTTGPGPRWHRDLTKWFSNDQMRRLVDEKELIGTISGATRGAGEYETRFDGTDNDGKPLKPGKYALCLEAAREHGTHQFVRESVEWGEKPIAKKDLKGGTEFSAVSYRFVPGAVVPEKGVK